ncbi:RNA polymerase factor sigma-54 [Pradoshia eiseniae]|nr:RNA polymerase factor sigma-54 [Pradoshia eiseniae]
MEMGLFQQQSLKLAMTPELSQAIMLLQYPAMELTAFMESKALDNPLIEVETGYQSSSRGWSQGDMSWIHQISDERPDLHSYLKGQIPFKEMDTHEQRILNYMIDNIDDNGYLRLTYEEINAVFPVLQTEWEMAKSILQTLEPAGAGAESLSDCLLIQARRDDNESALLNVLLKDYFTAFVEKKWKELSRTLGVSVVEIQRVFDQIQSYNPRPGAAFGSERSQYSVPDVRVYSSKGKLVAEIVESSRVRIREFAIGIEGQHDEAAERYMHQKRMEYRWLQKAIQQRNETLLHVTYAIIEKQLDYFLTGKSDSIKPLVMKEIADVLEIHESTVSRAVRDKMIETPFGTIPMRMFFSSSLQTDQKADASALKVKKEIEKLVGSEDKAAPLSDQAISDYLKQNSGIVISRRTVSKYREQLGIPSSAKRRRY